MTYATLPSLDYSDFLEDLPDPNEMCRLCMCVQSNDAERVMVELSAKNPHSDTPIPQLFAEGLNIDVDDTSAAAMPKKICEECLLQLNSFAIFKKRSLEVDAKLRHIVLRKQQLSEAQALYGPVFFDFNLSTHCSTNAAMDPECFETIDHDVKSGLPSTALQRRNEGVETLLDMKHSKVSRGLKIQQIKATSSCSRDVGLSSQEECIKSIKGAEQKISLDPQTSSAIDVCLDFDKSFMREVSKEAVHIPYQSQQVASSATLAHSTVDEDFFCSNVVGEIVISNAGLENQTVDFSNQTDVGTDGDDVHASDMVSGNEEEEIENMVLGNEEEEIENIPQDISSSSSTILPPHGQKKRSVKRDPLVVPEVHVVEDDNGSKHFSFGCPLCRQTFESRLLFRKHMPSHVRQKGGTCKYCDKWFPTHNALVRHERIHSGARPFVCLLCERSFSQKEILQRHIYTHSDQKPYPCDHCEKSYTQKEGLASHVKNCHPTVCEIVQHQCPLCDKAFCHPSGLSRHMAIHSGKQYICEVCHRNFNDSSSLRRHLKKMHPVLHI